MNETRRRGKVDIRVSNLGTVQLINRENGDGYGDQRANAQRYK